MSSAKNDSVYKTYIFICVWKSFYFSNITMAVNCAFIIKVKDPLQGVGHLMKAFTVTE